MSFFLSFGTSWAQSNEAQTAEQRIETLQRHAIEQYHRGNLAKASETFRQILTLDPGHQLDEQSVHQRIRAAFAQIKQDFEPEETVELTLRVPPHLPRQGAFLVRAHLFGPTGGVAKVIAYARLAAQPETDFQLIPMIGSDDAYSAQLQVPPAGQSLELYVEVRSPSNYLLVSSGSPSDTMLLEAAPPDEFSDSTAQSSGVERSNVPLGELTGDGTTDEEIMVATDEQSSGSPSEREERPRRRWYRSWWFWTIVGVVVAGGAAAAVVLTVPREDGAGTLGTMNLP